MGNLLICLAHSLGGNFWNDGRKHPKVVLYVTSNHLFDYVTCLNIFLNMVFVLLVSFPAFKISFLLTPFVLGVYPLLWKNPVTVCHLQMSLQNEGTGRIRIYSLLLLNWGCNFLKNAYTNVGLGWSNIFGTMVVLGRLNYITVGGQEMREQILSFYSVCHNPEVVTFRVCSQNRENQLWMITWTTVPTTWEDRGKVCALELSDSCTRGERRKQKNLEQCISP